MPTQTFQNLSDEKKNTFLNACFEEFTLKGYESASLNSIVRKTGIAKGSIYRYFENKRDLYFYLIKHATQMRLKNVHDLFEDPEVDFFDLMVQNFAEKIDFDLQYPLISGFQYSITQEVNCPELGNMLLKTKLEIMEMVKGFITSYQKKGKLRKDIDTDLMAYQIVQVQLGIYDYLAIKYNIDFKENILNKKPVFSIPKEDIVKIVKNFSELLKSGLQQK